jgi:hypothetical protein
MQNPAPYVRGLFDKSKVFGALEISAAVFGRGKVR